MATLTKDTTIKYFTELAGYTVWADNIVIEWLNQISEEQWNQVIISSFSSIRQTATHLVSAEKIWIDFWTNTPYPVYLSAGFKGTKNDLTEIWKKTSADLKNFIANYPEENYSKQINLKKPNGEKDQMEFSKTFLHLINHTTFHRGQLVTLLRQAGFTKLCSTDLFNYYNVIK